MWPSQLWELGPAKINSVPDKCITGELSAAGGGSLREGPSLVEMVGTALGCLLPRARGGRIRLCPAGLFPVAGPGGVHTEGQ